MADASAEGEAGNAGGGGDPGRYDDAVLDRHRIDVLPGAPAPDTNALGVGVDVDVRESSEVDDECAVPDTEPAGVVTSTAHAEVEALRPREVHAGGDVALVDAHRNGGGGPVDHAVVDSAGLVELGVRHPEQSAVEPAGERVVRCGRRGGVTGGVGHGSSSSDGLGSVDASSRSVREAFGSW